MIMIENSNMSNKTAIRMVNLIIDDKPVQVAEGTTVLRAAQSVGIHIPTLCDHPELEPYGGCRLCLVEVKGARLPMASCTLPVSEGMVVVTQTPRLKQARHFILSMLFSERNHFCPFCQVSGGDCELQNAAYEQEMTHWPIQPNWDPFPVDASHPYFMLDSSRCILCRRCIRACAELVGNHTLTVEERGTHTLLVTDSGLPWGSSSCVSCGTCVQVCPTGALMHRDSAYLGKEKQAQQVQSICVGCSVGCNIVAFTHDNQLLRIDGDWEGIPNHGLLCRQGRLEPLREARQRLTTPLVRKNGKLQPATWEEALDVLAARLPGQRLAALASTRLTAEALTLFQQIFAGQLQAATVTSMEEGRTTGAVVQMAQKLGHAFEANLDALRQADCIVAVGVNLYESHQVAGFITRRGLWKDEDQTKRLVIIDPAPEAMGNLAELAGVTGSLLRSEPGSDAATLRALAANLGRPESDNHALNQAAVCLSGASRVVFIYGKGVTAHPAAQSAATLDALLDLAQAVRSAGATDVTLLSVKGEANSLAAALYGLDQPFELDERAPVEAAYLAIGDDYYSKRLLDRLAGVPFVAVQAAYRSELSERADVVLPVEMWAETDGHYVNLEGRIQHAARLLQAPKGVLSNEAVLTALAKRLGLMVPGAQQWAVLLSQRISPNALVEM